jgi:hypothetical protein
VIDGYSVIAFDEKEELVQLPTDKEVIASEIKNFFK